MMDFPSDDEIESRCRRIIRARMDSGSDEVEAFARFTQTRRVTLVSSLVAGLEERIEMGVNARAFRGGVRCFQAFSWGEPDPESIIISARPAEPILPHGHHPRTPCEALPETVDYSILSEYLLRSDAGGMTDLCELAGTRIHQYIFNSHGLAAGLRHSLYIFAAQAGSCAMTHASTDLMGIRAEAIVGRVREAEQATRDASEIALSGICAVSPSAASRLVALLVECLQADHVRSSRFPRGLVVGEQCFANAVSAVDDGGKGPFGAPFDGEGIPTRARSVIHEGRLETLLFDSYEAARHQTVSTGNSIRHSYLKPPSIGSACFWLSPGSETTENLRDEAGFEITDLPTQLLWNQRTGEFAFHGWGWKLAHGFRQQPVSFLLHGMLLPLFQSVLACAGDLEYHPFDGWVGSPTLLINLHRI